MKCIQCKKEIASTSMWHCYRNGTDVCNSCIIEYIRIPTLQAAIDERKKRGYTLQNDI